MFMEIIIVIIQMIEKYNEMDTNYVQLVSYILVVAVPELYAFVMFYPLVPELLGLKMRTTISLSAKCMTSCFTTKQPAHQK